MLKGIRVNLRLFRDEDVEPYLDLYNECVWRGEHYPVGLYAPATVRRRVQENGWWGDDFGYMLITDKEDVLRGVIFFFKGAPTLEGYEIGYLVFRPEDRGRGYVSEALPLFSAYLFAAKPIERLYLLATVENTASRRVAEKAGYRLEGILRRAFFLQGVHRDCALYALLRDECPAWERLDLAPE